MNSKTTLFVVLPVYNEAASIKGVVEEWVKTLRELNIQFQMMVINDGSTDQTREILSTLPYSELRVCNRKNVGHGPSCWFGYQTAIARGAEWVLQIDSDGQCNPAYFPQFWEARATGPVVFGYRARRDDGLSRWLISRVVSLVVFLNRGHWIKDANVPYRLIRTDHLEKVFPHLPPAFFTNILLSSLLAKKIRWKPIRFRKRSSGNSTINLSALFRYTGQLSRELKYLNKTNLWGERMGKSTTSLS